MTATLTKTFTILDHEFDIDQLNEIATHGMSQGVNGFIYSSELHDIFERHEHVILDALDSYADDIGASSAMSMITESIQRGDDEHHYTMQDIKETAVWMYVEMVAHNILVENEHPDWY